MDISSLCLFMEEVLARQETDGDGIRGFFYEKDRMDAFRSIAYARQLAWAILKLLKINPPELQDHIECVSEAMRQYCDHYLVADAASDPFACTPYGVFIHRVQAEKQTFRDAGNNRGIRSFMHSFNRQGIAHGTSSVLMSHAAVLAKAGTLLDRDDWRMLAEKQLQWTLGHNTLNRSLYTGIGCRQPVAYGFRVTQIPEGTVAGKGGKNNGAAVEVGAFHQLGVYVRRQV